MKLEIFTIFLSIWLYPCSAIDDEFKRACENYNAGGYTYAIYYHQTCYIQNRTGDNYEYHMHNCKAFKGGHLIYMFDDDLIDLLYRRFQHGTWWGGILERNLTEATGLHQTCKSTHNLRARINNWYAYDVNSDRHWKLPPKFNCDNFFRWAHDDPCGDFGPHVNNYNIVYTFNTGAISRNVDYKCYPDDQPATSPNPMYGNFDYGPHKWGCICEYRSPMQTYKLAYEGVKLHRLNQILEESPVYNVDLIQCALTCRKLPVCFSFAHNEHKKVCELYWFSDGHAFFKSKQKPAFGYGLYTLA